MSQLRNSLKTIAIRMVLLTTVAASLVAASGSAVTADPSPYCRPQVGTPYVSKAPKYQGNNHFTFTVTVYVTMTCNGSINSSSVTALLHYTLDGSGDHIATGTAEHCTSTCEASASLTESFLCTDYNYMSFHGAITGWWMQTSTSSKATLSGTGPTYNDSWADGDGVCP